MATLSVSASWPPFPEGSEMNADAFLEWLAENLSVSLDGEGLTGQIGGNKPDGDKGIWFSPNSIESFREGQYQTITDVPIGTVLMWASKALTPPVNYLFCTNPSDPSTIRSVAKSDYPLLYNVIGNSWGADPGTTGNFNLPFCSGRMPCFSGIADLGQGLKGREKTTGMLTGSSTPHNTPPYPASPPASKGGRYYNLGPSTTFAVGAVEPAQIVMAAIIRYR